jgi:hypothetical protein
MATRPTQDFEWATSGLKTDPGAGKKDVGFLVGEKPPARWFNYLYNLIAQWLGYLDDIDHDAYELPLDISQRIVQSGTWTIGTGGAVTQAADGAACVVPITIPVGFEIVTVRIRGQQTGGTDQFLCELHSAAGVGSGTTDIGGTNGSSNSGITGSIQNVSFSPPAPVTTDLNTRYFVSVQTFGGGAGNRIITGAWITIQRPI